MARLSKDVTLNEEKFKTAASEMGKLKTRTETLKEDLKSLYDGLVEALKSEAGDELDLAAEDVLFEPIENLSLVIKQISDTLNTIIGNGYYNDIFRAFDELKNNL